MDCPVEERVMVVPKDHYITSCVNWWEINSQMRTQKSRIHETEVLGVAIVNQKGQLRIVTHRSRSAQTLANPVGVVQ